MSTLLDAYAAIALLRGEPAADDVQALMKQGPVWTTAVNAAEIVDRMVRLADADPDDVKSELVMLGIGVVPLSIRQAIDAGECRARNYHRERCPVSLADCVAAVAARQAASTLATADPHLAYLAAHLGVTVTTLPDSQGRRPSDRSRG
jgi:predicted nucleic acid-binding protein